MMVRLAVAALVNSVFINGQTNMAAGARQINIGIFFPIANYPRFILNQYQDISQKPLLLLLCLFFEMLWIKKWKYFPITENIFPTPKIWNCFFFFCFTSFVFTK